MNKKAHLPKNYLLSISMVLFLSFSVIANPEVFAGTQSSYYIENGGHFSLEQGQKIILQFKGFSERELYLKSIEKGIVTLQCPGPGDIRHFFKENEGLDINKQDVYLKIGEKAYSYESEEMVIIIKLESLENNKAIFTIKYYAAPPAPKIWPWQKIKITLSSD